MARIGLGRRALLSIKKAKSKEKQYKLTDGEGMFLRVYPNGSKYWQLQYWFEGKQKILSLGVWPEVSLTQAREKKVEARKIIKQGIDPLQEKKHEIINMNEQELEYEIEQQRKAIMKLDSIIKCLIFMQPLAYLRLNVSNIFLRGKKK